MNVTDVTDTATHGVSSQVSLGDHLLPLSSPLLSSIDSLSPLTQLQRTFTSE